MELRQLGYFLAVAQEESFTRAAQAMHVAQPGISQQIRRLERDLGEPLFDRSNQTVRLTPAGMAFLPHARAALAATDAGRAAIAELHGLVHGQLRLGTIQGVPQVDLTGLLASFHAAHPGVDITLREEHPEPLIEQLYRGDHDAAILGLSHPEAPDGLSIDVISIEPLVLVTSPEHRFGDRRQVAVSELRRESFVMLPRASALRRHVEDACGSAGFPPRIALETSDVHLLSGLVARGLGVTIVPRSVAAAGGDRHALRVIEIKPAITKRCTALAWRTAGPQPAAARAFLAFAREMLTSSTCRGSR